MPRATIAADHPDRVLPAEEIAPAVAAILNAPLSGNRRMSEHEEDEMAIEASYAALDADAIAREGAPGTLVPMSCPACGGSLWQLEDSAFPRFRCRVGHAYSLETALEDQESALDRALWTALRALLERASIAHRISERTAGSSSAARFEQMERDARTKAEVIRNVLLRRNGGDNGD
jgi:two-component system chemotaxis response regulator CheB